MASIYLKDAYYSCPIAKEHQKYLNFLGAISCTSMYVSLRFDTLRKDIYKAHEASSDDLTTKGSHL